MKKTYIFLAEGFETVEALGVVDMLRRAGLPIETVSITDQKEVTTAHNITVIADKTFDETDFSDAELLIIPGGIPGTIHLGECDKLLKLLQKHAAEGKKLAAICAGPSVLGKLGLLNGKRACCYPGYEDQLTGAKVSMNEVEVDGNFITGRGMGVMIPFSAAIIEMLADKELAEKIKNKIIYKQNVTI